MSCSFYHSSAFPGFKSPKVPRIVIDLLNTQHNQNVLLDAFPTLRQYEGNQEKVSITRDMADQYVKKVLEHNLTQHVYARLFKSTYGVGVVSIRHIPAGVTVFDSTLGVCTNQYPVVFTQSEISQMKFATKRDAQNMLEFLKDFYVSTSSPTARNLELPINILGPNMLDVSFFLNHSEDPNLEIVMDGVCDMSYYRAKRSIPENEELTINYRDFGMSSRVLESTMPFLRGGGAAKRGS
jgi:hypothetical protein